MVIDLAGRVPGQPLEDLIGKILHDARYDFPDGRFVGLRPDLSRAEIAFQNLAGVTGRAYAALLRLSFQGRR